MNKLESTQLGAIMSNRNKKWNLRLDTTKCPTKIHQWSKYL